LFEISGRNAKITAKRMADLAEKKEYSITEKEKAILDKEFFGGFASEDDMIEAMYETFDEYGYAMDTHTGVALAVCAQYQNTLETDDKKKKDKTPIVVLSTANPYKFPQDVLYALSGNDVKDSFKGIKRLNLLTAMKPPRCLLDLRYRPLRFKTVVDNDLKAMSQEVLKFAGGQVVPVPDANK
jgi:threonine synthase